MLWKISAARFFCHALCLLRMAPCQRMISIHATQVKRAALRDRTNDGGGSGLDGPASPRGGTAEKNAAGEGGAGKDAGFAPNLVRGCSWSYGWEAVEAFLKANSFRGILRAHSVQVIYLFCFCLD